jgi:hypothetical protein
MATRKNSTVAHQNQAARRFSLISTLAHRRTTIIQDADAENGRDLKREEIAQVDALNSVIAHSTARNAHDAAIQVDLALEYVELCSEVGAPLELLSHAHAALTSARAALAAAEQSNSLRAG